MFGESSSEKIRIIFDETDPLDLRITVPEQAAFRESNYGYDSCALGSTKRKLTTRLSSRAMFV